MVYSKAERGEPKFCAKPFEVCPPPKSREEHPSSIYSPTSGIAGLLPTIPIYGLAEGTLLATVRCEGVRK